MKPKKPVPIIGLRPTRQRGINPKEEFGFAKVPMAYVPESSLVMLALAMKNGMKYGPYNYRKVPMQGLTLLDACKRHISALIDGEDFDPKTGIPHAAFGMATLCIYLDCWLRGTIIDNRPLPGVAGQLIELLNDVPGVPPKTPGELKAALEDFVTMEQKKQEWHEDALRDVGEPIDPVYFAFREKKRSWQKVKKGKQHARHRK